MIERLTILGVGLIGGSLARALRAAGQVREIVGYGRTLANLQDAVRLGVIDRAEVSLTGAVQDADMVVLAVPVGTMPEVLPAIAPHLRAGAVLTDVGSVKGSVIVAARKHLGSAMRFFVPGHPIAGTESSGVLASFADLFRGQKVVLTPEPETDAAAVERVREMWQATGAQVSTMEATRHDEVLAASSHLPHALAFVLVDMLVRLDDHRAIFDCAGGGFRDFTRIAASDPVMWRDIMLNNRDALLALLTRYGKEMEALADAIEEGDTKYLTEVFTRAKHAREALKRSK